MLLIFKECPDILTAKHYEKIFCYLENVKDWQDFVRLVKEVAERPVYIKKSIKDTFFVDKEKRYGKLICFGMQ